MATTFDPFRDLDRMLPARCARRPRLRCRWTSTAPGDRFVAHVDLPGVDPSTIDVDVEDRTLTIRAERREQARATSSGSRTSARPAPSPVS